MKWSSERMSSGERSEPREMREAVETKWSEGRE
jgi:hypothetical protein